MTDWYKIKRILVRQNNQEKQIYPATWHPWANTLAYYNIDANDTTSIIYDKSWNSRNLTWYWTWAYTTDANAWKVAVFNWASYASLGWYINPWWTAYTLLLWGKYSSWGTYVSQWSSSSRLSTIAMFTWGWTYETPAVSSSWIDFNPEPPTNTWSMLVWVRDGSSISIYYNGQLNGQKTDSNIQTDWTSWGYWQLWGNRQQYDFLTWQIKTVIFENKAWSASEILDYYNQTKSNYGF